jgi:hypothetical protein
LLPILINPVLAADIAVMSWFEFFMTQVVKVFGGTNDSKAEGAFGEKLHLELEVCCE